MRCVIIPYVKIAVVEDDKIVRDFVVEVLTFSVNREILAFDNGFDALCHLDKREGPDIVLASANLPEISGFDLLSRIKEKFPRKVCIIMSQDPANEKKAESFGADAFLAKPFSVNEIFNIVQTFVIETEQ